jgi:hypothetical protein
MIHERNGRSISEQTREELEALLQEEYGRLSPDERAALEYLLGGGDFEDDDPRCSPEELMRGFSEAHYVRPMVDMETFILDEYYLGNTCKGIFPKLLDDLKEAFEGNYNEVIFTGAIGTGKTFASSIGVCRVLYELSCLRNPQESYGLTSDTPISIAGFSVNEELAKEVVLKNVVGKIGASPYFKEHFPYNITQRNIRFPNNVLMVARATTARGALGMSLLAAIIDETNFMPIKKGGRLGDNRYGAVNMAKEIYDAITRRIKSRYGRNGKLFLPSSKSTQDSFISGRIQAAAKDPTIFVRDYSLWDVKPGDYSQRRFHVLCGNEQIHSKIITDDLELERLQKDLPDRTVLIEVPEDFRPDFESDLEGAIRDVAGVATVSISPFIQRSHKVGEAFDESRPPVFSHEIYDPSVGGSFLWDLMVAPVRTRGANGFEMRALKPRLNPGAPRHVHIDPSLKNCSAGFAMAHVGAWSSVERMAQNHRRYAEHAPYYVVDVALQIIPPTGGELDFEMYRQLIYQLSEHGYHITRVTMDSWQSVDMLQQMQKKGYETGQVSMDKNWDPYQNLKQALYENRLACYSYDPLRKELIGLEADWEKRRINKPEHGSKDVADAVAGVCYSLLHHQPAQAMLPMKGLMAHGDADSHAWMAEQRHAAAAGKVLGLDGVQSSGNYTSLSVLPPFMVGGGGGNWPPY